MSYLTASWNVIGLNKYWLFGFGVPLCGYWFGRELDLKEKERSATFRDRSALFGGRVKPGDPPSW